jgi:hypothetical protein
MRSADREVFRGRPNSPFAADEEHFHPENYQIDTATISADDVRGDAIAFRLSRPNAG